MSFAIDLPRRLDSAATARQAIGRLAGDLPEDQVGDVRLLVSELVTNALRHAEMDPEESIRLSIEVKARHVRVEVGDSGPGFEPQALPESPEEADGWGLYLVATLSDRWGVEGDGRGTLVWFELDRQPSDEVAAA